MHIFSFGKRIMTVLAGSIVLITVSFSPVLAAEKHSRNSEAGSQAILLTNECYFPALLTAIEEAQSEIFISIFSFKTGVHKNNYPDRILGHLVKAVKRGVKVTVILETTGKHSDELTSQNRHTGKILEEKDIKVYYDKPRKQKRTQS